MGGQACVFYGAAEFSRDCDIVLLARDDNYARLNSALDALDAECIAVPPFNPSYLDRGHAVHFRCHLPDADRMRLDVMTKMRGVDDFNALWLRRTTLEDAHGMIYELLGIHDLVKAKKTQRDKDWPMIRRLVESHYATYRGSPNSEQVDFWLLESRTPSILIEIVAEFPDNAKQLITKRPLIDEAFAASHRALESALAVEEQAERTADRLYWASLKNELEKLRFQKRSDSKASD